MIRFGHAWTVPGLSSQLNGSESVLASVSVENQRNAVHSPCFLTHRFRRPKLLSLHGEPNCRPPKAFEGGEG